MSLVTRKCEFPFFIGHLLELSIFIYFILHNLLTGPRGICRKEMLKIPGELPQLEKILKRFEHEYLLTVTLSGNNKWHPATSKQ